MKPTGGVRREGGRLPSHPLCASPGNTGPSGCLDPSGQSTAGVTADPRPSARSGDFATRVLADLRPCAAFAGIRSIAVLLARSVSAVVPGGSLGGEVRWVQLVPVNVGAAQFGLDLLDVMHAGDDGVAGVASQAVQ